MNAILFLIGEHDMVRATFAQITEQTYREAIKREMFDNLCLDLIRHETMEETVWYPRFKDNAELKDTVKHLLKEEKEAANLMKKFDKSKLMGTAIWNQKVLELMIAVEHHATEEETKLFPKVAKILGEVELERIGREMRAFKVQYNKNLNLRKIA